MNHSSTNTSKVTEIYGVAGSGKSTFVLKHNEYESLQLIIYVKIIIFIWAFISNIGNIYRINRAVSSLKYFRTLCFLFYKKEMITYVKKYKNGSFIYDQGPIYNYVSLRKKICKQHEKLIQKELNQIFESIKNQLDDTIYLKCDINAALNRVILRQKDHKYKKIVWEKALSDIALWEDEYERVAKLLSSKKIISLNHELFATIKEHT